MALAFYQVALLWTAFVFGLAYVTKTLLAPRRKGPPLPPGPKPLPIVGNINDLPSSDVPEIYHWDKHRTQYGPISSVTVMGQPLIFLHTSKLAFELLEKRSNIHSDRPHMTFSGDMVNLKDVMGSINNGPALRAQRKDVHSVIGTKSLVDGYADLQMTLGRRYLLCTMRQPENMAVNIQNVIGAIILQLAYGYKFDQRKSHDPLVKLIDEFMANFSDAATQGKWLVDIFPFLKHMPDWLPGTEFKKIAKGYRRTMHETLERPYAFAKKEVGRGTASESFLNTLLTKEGPGLSVAVEDRIKLSALALYSGGADTQVASLSWWTVATLLNPETQALAQREIDSVVGVDRLPTLADRNSLPYCNALWWEVLRWTPIGPLGLPHVASQDDTITVKTAGGEKVYSIPKGSILMPNIWSFCRDPNLYRDPEQFNPSRFLGKHPEQDPTNVCFGFGRRVCPGKVLADASGWLVMTQTLACFNVQRKEGAEVNPVGIPGIVLHANPSYRKAMNVSVREERRALLEKLEREEVWDDGLDGEKLKDIVVDLSSYE